MSKGFAAACRESFCVLRSLVVVPERLTSRGRTTMLDAGTKAPILTLEDSDGNAARLADLRGTSAVLMYFMRTTTCPVCNGHVRDLVARSDEFAARGVNVLIAVPEGRTEAASWKAEKEIPFTVVTGERGTPHESVGLNKKVFGALLQSGSILVDAKGVIRHSHAATLPPNAYDKKGLAAALDGLGLITA
jgi:peroxiredoxin